jgi:hypothetical protein
MQRITFPIDFVMMENLTRRKIRENATYNSPHRLLYGGKVLQGEKFEQMQLITLPIDFNGGKSYKAKNLSKCNI